MSYRIDSVVQGFADEFLRASLTSQRATLVAACEAGLRNAGVMEPVASNALELIRRGGTGTDALRWELDGLVAQYDEAYFSRVDAEGGLDDEAVSKFSKARAFAALSYALGAEADWLEALYEAVSTLEGQEPMVERLRAVLTA
ncbi:hypothetical protein [Corallococcus macrosporus]|uniref:Uncharacterized protein n=2 Tax=Myxococcaceae TaxID=31 RepID=A0A250JT29_9BACT|nr:hypothetical protein [Corallococcus macrosporus]AEI65714.1 hypothetical protein LILAB_19060 [Corallococcus macrosporus]ATB46637.1 hypothetical protein MYMAC_002242 [Corallococcus macrosporus DSM 14697]